MPTLDFFFDFASTYSYPAAMRIARLAADARVDLRWRPFLLGPIFKSQGWDTSPFNLYPAKGCNMVRDLERLCAELGQPFRMPNPFPQNSLLAARVAHIGLGEGWGEDFSRAVYRAEFAEGRPISEPSVIEELLRELRVDPEPALAQAKSDAVKTKLRAETAEAQRLGVFGAPTFLCSDGELFWGNDRLERALAWANGQQLTTDVSRSKKTFTPKQGQYLRFIHLYTRLHGRAPAETDMQEYFRVSPPSVHQMVLTLERRGLIRRKPRTPRSIELLVDPTQLPQLQLR